jgi:hypothetical protein
MNSGGRLNTRSCSITAGCAFRVGWHHVTKRLRTGAIQSGEPIGALRESTTFQSTGTTLRTGLCSSPFKLKCRNPRSFDPMIGICGERSDFTR